MVIVFVMENTASKKFVEKSCEIDIQINCNDNVMTASNKLQKEQKSLKVDWSRNGHKERNANKPPGKNTVSLRHMNRTIKWKGWILTREKRLVQQGKPHKLLKTSR